MSFDALLAEAVTRPGPQLIKPWLNKVHCGDAVEIMDRLPAYSRTSARGASAARIVISSDAGGHGTHNHPTACQRGARAGRARLRSDPSAPEPRGAGPANHQDRDHHYADRPHRTQARRLRGQGEASLLAADHCGWD